MNKPLLFLAASALVAVTAAACAPTPPPVARATLDCPAEHGRLTRTSIAADHKSCVYTSRNGDEVSLRLVAFTGDVETALKPIQQELEGEIAPETPAVAESATGDKGAPAPAAGKGTVADAVHAAKEAAEDAKAEAADAAASIKDGDDRDDHPGRGRHERTQVDLPGIHISADDDGKADVNVGMIHVNASDDGAVVHVSRDVRMRGRPFTRDKPGFRASYILAKDNLKDGYRAVGYEAGGPRKGPIAVAVVKSRNGDHDDIFHDVQKLVRENGGV